MAATEENIIQQPIEKEMRTSYLDYAMSVIVSRALPDVRDGLKPVQRRILYGASEMGLAPDRPYRKCARVVGDVMGRYHPHGDVPVYEALVRMAQDFSFRYPLIDGQGNFGSVDGDPPGAMRYTEARLSRMAMELLADIDKETVPFVPNFDQSMQEPVVLPSRVPNLLMNGASGIAVGMATNIPPHNLGELVDALVALIDDPNLEPEALLKIVKGPDFPTGGRILGRDGIRAAYLEGRGSMIVRAETAIEELRGGRMAIIVTELPYMVNKAAMVERIAQLVREKKLAGVSDLRDESDRQGMRVVIELRRDVNPQIVQNQLFKHTQMQTTFGAIMLALVDGVPRVLPLKQILAHYLAHRKVVVTRRTEYELRKAKARAHILEGLKVALKSLDDVIALIRKAKDVPAARAGLMSKFKLSELQADAILEMRLQRLTQLEREKLDEEYKELIKAIAQYEDVLRDEHKVFEIIKAELVGVKERFGDPRRTRITGKDAELDVEDLIPDAEVVITLTHNGYVKRLPLETYRRQNRGGRGVMGMGTKEEDYVEVATVTTNHAFVLFFSNRGKVYRVKAYEVPEAGRTAKGTSLVNLFSIAQGERVNAIIPIRSFEDTGDLFFATKHGNVKKTGLMEFINAKRAGIAAITLDKDDELVAVRLTDGKEEVLLATRNGQAIRFKEANVREMGRAARGVIGITLRRDDALVGMAISSEGKYLLVASELGLGKRTLLSEYRLQRRGGSGVRNIRLTARTGKVAAIRAVDDEDEVLVITAQGIVSRLLVKDISTQGREAQGVRLQRLDEGDRVSAIAPIAAADEAAAG
ncbi:MAG: DNA gyrase subunit A [Bacillati bacterium ANGP1]|uniref:DNA gyrase subunit A n=1 Tax=Candidatus Segetimicrobium genomatis TaxID=2569760 RepID=A0A537K352_9BACT|nr:MAG: DNA gyrase subunit A [Terrabacteria group bacterium ANGP1]